jgi:hypothetical protein
MSRKKYPLLDAMSDDYKIAFADGRVEGYEEAVADIVAWLRIKYPRATSVPAQIERGDARGAAGKAGVK